MIGSNISGGLTARVSVSPSAGMPVTSDMVNTINQLHDRDVTSDPVGQVLDDAPLHQLSEKLFLFGYVVCP